MDVAAEHTEGDHQPPSQVELSEALSAIQNGSDAPASIGEDESNKFQKAISAWRNIDLINLVPTLDTTASDLVAQQRDALVERKELAQKTKDFRKLEDPLKLTEIKTLLKAYQSYIDLISTHNKSVSSSFLNVYSSLSEAPDPYPLLEASIDSLVLADETVPKLEAENKHLQTTISKLTSQLDATERRLEQETSQRRDTENSSSDKAKEIEASWSAVIKEKEDNWAAREKSLEERGDNYERLLKEVKANFEVSQRLNRDDDSNGAAGANAAELEIVNSDLERANSRLLEMENRNEYLRLELAQATTEKSSKSTTPNVEEDPAYLRLRSENSSLLRKADAARYEKESRDRDWENKQRALSREVAILKEASEKLRFKVTKWSDYDEVKGELEVLRSIEFSTGDVDDHAEGDELQETGTIKGGEKKLEQLLLARNKKLNDELTILRVSQQDLIIRLESMQNKFSSTNMELENARSLTSTLEHDLSRLQQEASGLNPAMSVTGTYISRAPASSYNRRGRVSPTSSIISGFETNYQSSNVLESLRAGEPAGGGSGILPMITAQRDRFKKKNSELETELSKTFATVSSLRSEISSLQKDNLNLYEKTRYVSTYGRNQPATPGQNFAPNPNPSTVQIGSENIPFDRYKAAYESKLSPFAAFRGQESAGAVRRMSLPERGLLRVTRLIFASRTSRNVFGAYLLALHILLVTVFFSMSDSSSCSAPAVNVIGTIVKRGLEGFESARQRVPQELD